MFTAKNAGSERWERRSCVRSAIWLPRRLTLGEFTCDNNDDDTVPRNQRNVEKRQSMPYWTVLRFWLIPRAVIVRVNLEVFNFATRRDIGNLAPREYNGVFWNRVRRKRWKSSFKNQQITSELMRWTFWWAWFYDYPFTRRGCVIVWLGCETVWLVWNVFLAWYPWTSCSFTLP